MNRLLFKLLIAFLPVVLALNAEAAVSDISRIYHQAPSLEGFDICSGGGCADITHVSFDHNEWQTVAAIFASHIEGAPMDEAQERMLIAEAIGMLESIVGAKTGTSTDRAGTFNNADYPGQLDCNDEAINSTTYLRLMRKNGLIKWHEVEDMRTRDFFFTGWPHSTAVIHEISSGKRYAVDSWFYENGEPATIVPFQLWKSGYIPDDSPLAPMRNAQHFAD